MSKEEAQQLLYQMQMLESYYVDLTQRENTLVNLLREATSAVESIKTINEKSASDTLVPLGVGTFVNTKISSTDKILLYSGADVAIEKNKDSALAFLESRIKEVEVALQENAAKKQDAGSKLEQGKQEMNRLLQTTPKPKN